MKKYLFFLALTFGLSLIANAQTDFITLWDLTKLGTGANNRISFGIERSSNVSLNYSWETVAPAPFVSGSGTFPAAGAYGITPVAIGNLPTNTKIKLKLQNKIGFWGIKIDNGADRLRLIDVQKWGGIKCNLANAFYGCANLQISANDAPNLNMVGPMSYYTMYQAFRGCSLLNSGNLNSWDVSSIDNFEKTFYGAASFNQSLSNWNTGDASTMREMFSGASSFNQPLNNWDVSAVTDMYGMFQNATSFNQPLNNWDVDKVTNMAYMFYNAQVFNQHLNSWNTAKVTDMSHMFQNAKVFNRNITPWNTGSVTDMSFMFSDAKVFNTDVSAWNTTNVTSMSFMFRGAEDFNQPINSWNVSKVTDMQFVFKDAKTFNQALNGWNVLNVTNMQFMFSGASKFNQNLAAWDVDNVTNMTYMFAAATDFNQSLDLWDIDKVTNMKYMFSGATAFNKSLATWGQKFNNLVELEHFLDNCGMSVANYDATLIAFDAVGVPNGRNMGALNLQYCIAAPERAHLVKAFFWGGKGWTITGDSPVNPTIPVFAFGTSLSICSGANVPLLPTITLSPTFVLGTWSPSVISNTTSGVYTFTPSGLQCATTTMLTVTVKPTVSPSFTPISPICAGAALANLPLVSTNLVTGTWSPAINKMATTTYTFTPANIPGTCVTTTSLVITVKPTVSPSFTTISPICAGTALANLPLVSTNLITGTWSPAINNKATTTYTFTPVTIPGQCVTTTTLVISVTPLTTPVFSQLPAMCSGVLAPTLVSTSSNGINGIWSPSIVSTLSSGIYTFTPIGGQCVTTTTMYIAVNPANTVPTFDPITICSGDLSATLPLVSNNGIIGTWFPGVIDTNTSGTYTFTPAPNQCAISTVLTVTVNSNTSPTFDAILPICSGDLLAPLPLVSNEGITGTWSPAVNNKATTIYTFTPDKTPGQCATTSTLTITVTPQLTATFNGLPTTLCQGELVPSLLTTSTNGITGDWLPAAIDNNNSGVYTFTPTAGQCAANSILSVTVNPNLLPEFDPISPICSGASLAPLPLVSTNNISGIWSPVINNQATTTYTFTPTAGQCVSTLTVTLVVTVTPNLLPEFTAVPEICEGAALANLPLVSTNLVTGTWSPAINNQATTTYTFTPTAGQCVSTLTVTSVVTVNPNILPDFTAVPEICEGEVLTDLPTVSNNGISGVWSPMINNTTTTNYEFTPTPGQCATVTNLTITVNPTIAPTFNDVPAICQGESLSDLPLVSNNFITGTWSPAINNTTTITYTFTPDFSGQCATQAALSVTVISTKVPTFNSVTAICSGATLADLPVVSTNNITGTWSPAINNSLSTTYTFTPTAGQCASTNTLAIVVDPILTPTFAPVAAVCEGGVLADLPVVSTNLITGTWSPAMDNTKSTSYTFIPKAGQCATTGHLLVDVLPFPEIELGADVYASTGEQVTLTVNGDSLVGWFPSGILSCATCNTPSFVADSTVVFYAEAANSIGCKTLDSVRVFVEKDTYLYIPNSFSPNGDGRNDIFNAVSYKKLSYTMQVYDRWGELVYQWTDTETGWDGTYNGEKCAMDVYVYILKAKDYQNKPIKLQGTVTMIK